MRKAAIILATVAAFAVPAFAQQEKWEGVVTAPELKVRNCAGLDRGCTEVGRLKQGNHVSVVDDADVEGWVKIVGNSQGQKAYGFINSKYLDRVARPSPAATPQASTPAATQTAQNAPVAASQTLEDQEQLAEYLLEELTAAQTRGESRLLNGAAAALQGYCQGNPFAQALGCPKEYITQSMPSASAGLTALPQPVGDEPLIVRKRRAHISNLVAQINMKFRDIKLIVSMQTGIKKNGNCGGFECNDATRMFFPQR